MKGNAKDGKRLVRIRRLATISELSIKKQSTSGSHQSKARRLPRLIKQKKGRSGQKWAETNDVRPGACAKVSGGQKFDIRSKYARRRESYQASQIAPRSG